MKIKRFIAKNMREAIRMVRDEQGPDSVILSNRRVQGGIEVVAAVDYDEALMQQSLRRAAQPVVAAVPPPPPPPPPKPEPVAHSIPMVRSPLELLLAEFGEPDAIAPAAITPPQPTLQRAAAAPTMSSGSNPSGAAAPGHSSHSTQSTQMAGSVRPVMASTQAASLMHAVSGSNAVAASMAPPNEYLELQRGMTRELSDMRRMIEQQLAGLAWNDLRANRPQRYAVLKTLTDLGLDTALARDIADQLPDATTEERARFLPLGLLARRIPVAKHDVVLDGGIVALVGPTGVGKTTTIAKLAARYAERHGLRDIALVAMDHYRIGAQEQLYTYGRLLGVPVYTVTPQQSLRDTLAKLADRKLVLIDTVGMSPRDGALVQQIEMLADASPRLKAYLTISATSQSGDQDEVVRRFGGVQSPTNPGGRLAGCILSKLDETSRIGGALSVAIRHQLPLAYVTDGQRVPEDLQVARADQLVIRAQQLARATPMELDDEMMALKFASMFDGSSVSTAHGAIPTGAKAHV